MISNDRFAGLCRALLLDQVPVRLQAPGWSMHPTIRDGETILVEPHFGKPVRRGQVVLVELPRGLTAHRVVKVRKVLGGPVLVTTRGDSAVDPDPPFPVEMILGLVVAVERDGRRFAVDSRWQKMACVLRRFAREVRDRVLPRSAVRRRWIHERQQDWPLAAGQGG